MDHNEKPRLESVMMKLGGSNRNNRNCNILLVGVDIHPHSGKQCDVTTVELNVPVYVNM
jgi:hypothetical protein